MSFLQCIVFFPPRLIDHRCVGLFLDFAWCSIDLYFCFCAVPHCFEDGSIVVWSKVSLTLPAVFLFQDCFVFCAYMNKIVCSNFVKNAIGDLTGISLNLYNALSSIVIFDNTDSSNRRTWYIFASVCVIFSFFHQHLIVFTVQVFCHLR